VGIERDGAFVVIVISIRMQPPMCVWRCSKYGENED
jgi:hypothetical protein